MSTPTPEQIEAAAEAAREEIQLGGDAGSIALAALTAVYPLMEADALRDAADAMPECLLVGMEGMFDRNDEHRDWLRARAATIEGGSE